MIEVGLTDVEALAAEVARNPDSYLFARLSEGMLKAGLVDRALETARLGVLRHPQYVAGQRALAFAAYARGCEDECCRALQVVTEAVPEDTEAQKLLARLLVSAGRVDEAVRAYGTVLEFNPHDGECRGELDYLERKSGVSPAAEPDALDAEFGAFDDESEEEIIEDIEILEMDEADVIEESIAEPVEDISSTSHSTHDPLSTATLAELYLQQGFYDKALAIYRTMSAQDRADERVRRRIEELEARVAGSISGGAEAGTTSLPEASADTALNVLEDWLDNVRRYKACR